MKHWQPSLVTTDWLVQEVPLLRQVTPAELAIKGGLGIGVVFTKSSSYLSVNGDDWDNTAYDESEWSCCHLLDKILPWSPGSGARKTPWGELDCQRFLAESYHHLPSYHIIILSSNHHRIDIDRRQEDLVC